MSLFGGLEHFLFFHILDIIIPIDFHIFQGSRSTTNQVPSELAYGKRGAGAKIPPDAALVFTLELLKIKGNKVDAKSEL